MISFFARHPTVANILMLSILVMGITTLPGINRETFPFIEKYEVQVKVVYPGASPDDVETAICNRLEDATDGIGFTEEQRCEARDGIGILTMKMYETGDIETFLDDVKTAVDGVSDFPDEVDQPVVEKLGRTSDVIAIAITANQSLSQLKALAEYYRNQLLTIPQIPIVIVDNFSEHQLRVLIKAEALRQYNMSLQDVSNLIASQSLDLPVGQLESEGKTYQIRFDDARRTPDQLASLVILSDQQGGEVRLGDIARIEDTFELAEKRIEFNGQPAALLKVRKNTTDDTLRVFDAVKAFVDAENARLPEGTRLVLTQDRASIVRDRLQMLLKNSWQGLMLVILTLFLFFSWRYTFWVAMGLPVSFLGGLFIMSWLGVSINMISMVALLIAIGILMDDAIVLSESISSEYLRGKPPLQAAIDGTKRVQRGVLSSFITSALIFGSLLFLKGDLGQVLGVIPIVLLSVLTVSMIEGFLILPHHLKHSLEHSHERERPEWRNRFEEKFERLRERVGLLAETSVRYRYTSLGLVIGIFILSVSMLASGVLKFKAFPDIEGDIVEARILLPQGTPLHRTEQIVAQLIAGLNKTADVFSADEDGQSIIKNVQVAYSVNQDAYEEGPHVATISVDLLSTEERHFTLDKFRQIWRETTGEITDAIALQYKEPVIGPAGKAVHIRIAGPDLDELSLTSWQLQQWLKGYPGVLNVINDMRPGKPQFRLQLQPGMLGAGLDAREVANQLRAAYQGQTVDDIYYGREAYEVSVKLDSDLNQAMSDFDNLVVTTKTGVAIPLTSAVSLEPIREFSRIAHVNHQRVVNVYADVDANIANTSEVLADVKKRFFPRLAKEHPSLTFGFEGEIKNGAVTQKSMLKGFLIGGIGIFLLLSLQFRNYREPLIVMVAIPLSLIGVIWGHLLMGLDMTMPSMIGFVSLSGIVVNDSILLVEFVKYRTKEGMSLHAAASQAVRDRFRAILLTSITTIAGMLPLLSETSTQAQILVPLVTSIVFGLLASTTLILLVLPALYAIMEDIGYVKYDRDELDTPDDDFRALQDHPGQ
jgi:multidrug efflux pump subunit AcrB